MLASASFATEEDTLEKMAKAEPQPSVGSPLKRESPKDERTGVVGLALNPQCTASDALWFLDIHHTSSKAGCVGLNRFVGGHPAPTWKTEAWQFQLRLTPRTAAG